MATSAESVPELALAQDLAREALRQVQIAMMKPGPAGWPVFHQELEALMAAIQNLEKATASGTPRP